MIRPHPAPWFELLVARDDTAVVLAALMLGYTLIRDPGRAMRQLQSMVLAIL